MAKTERKIVKQVKNARLYSDGTIFLENVRASYPHLGTPGENEDDDGNVTKKFGITGMLPKATHKEAKELVKSVIQKLITDNEAKIPNHLWFLKDGDQSEKETNQGMFLVATSETRRPISRDRKANILEADEADELFYGGCWVNMLIRPWYFNGKAKKSNKTFPKRICASTVSVQFVRDDDPFGDGQINDDGVFDDVGDDGDAFGDDDDL